MGKNNKEHAVTTAIINFSNRHRFNLRRFFRGWIFWGIVMMLLNKTIWPELGVTDLKGFYAASTIWITTLSKICEFILPDLERTSEWLVNLACNAIEALKANWPSIAAYGMKLVGGMLTFLKQTGIFILLMLLLSVVGFVVLYLYDKPTAQKAWKDFKEEFTKWWNDLKKEWDSLKDVPDAEYEPVSENEDD